MIYFVSPPTEPPPPELLDVDVIADAPTANASAVDVMPCRGCEHENAATCEAIETSDLLQSPACFE